MFRHLSRLGALVVCALLGITLLLSGCGYRFAGAAGNRMASGQSLWVAFIVNETASPTAQTVIRRALLDEAHVMRGMPPAGGAASADMQVSGTLRSYSVKAVSYTAIDRAREYRLTIEVELELRRPGAEAPLWKGTLQAFGDFPVNADLALQRNAEEAALEAASRTLARTFLASVEQSY